MSDSIITESRHNTMQLSLFDNTDKNANDLPYPLLVSQKWEFDLSYHDIDGKPLNYLYHAVQWTKGLGASRETAWANLKKQILTSNEQLNVQQMPYIASDGKTYQVDFINQQDCYLVAQKMRVTKNNPQLKEIQEYLAKAGVFTDAVRRDMQGAGMALLATHYRKRGKSDDWIVQRLDGIEARNRLTDAMKEIIMGMEPKLYGLATDKTYRGLFERSAIIMRRELGLSENQNLRDEMGKYALVYLQATEEFIAEKLEAYDDLTWSVFHDEMLMPTVRFFSSLVKQHSNFLGRDLVTGQPLLAPVDND